MWGLCAWSAGTYSVSGRMSILSGAKCVQEAAPLRPLFVFVVGPEEEDHDWQPALKRTQAIANTQIFSGDDLILIFKLPLNCELHESREP